MKYVWYHANCNDGTTAASIALKVTPGAIAIPVKYNEPPPPFDPGDTILIVDFSYPRAVMEELIRRAKGVIVLDHHKTAETELKGLPHCFFDMERCGSVMAWDFFSMGSPRPRGLELIQDRDLWTKLWPEETAAFTAGLGLLDQVPGPEWYQAVCTDVYQEVAEQGEIIIRSNRKQMDRLMEHARLSADNVVSLNSPIHQSDLGELLLACYPEARFADLYYEDKGGQTIHSLRSRPGSDVDVSAIAKQYGGGGHKHAAGYKEVR